MRIKDLINCSRQMLFENADLDYAYSSRGTGFICRYCDRLFVVTARHVVDGFAPDALRVQVHPNGRDFVPHNARVTLVPVDANDPDHTDLAIFPLESALVDDTLFNDYAPYTLVDGMVRGIPPGNGQLIFRGFPHDNSFIDYDRLVIHQQPVILEGDRIGNSQMAHCHEIEIRDVSPCTTLDGMSGSPVFWVGEASPQRAHLFTGVMLRGTHASRRAHYVEGEVLVAALQRLTGVD
jgi:hypothetical protein